MAKSFEFQFGQLNPTPFNRRYKTSNPGMIVDNPRAVMRQLQKDTVQPDMFRGVRIFKGVVLSWTYENAEESELFAFFRRLFKNPVADGDKQNFFKVMIPELHAHLVNPLTIVDEVEQGRFLSYYPDFALNPSAGALGVQLKPGSLVEVEFLDDTFTHGQIKSVIRMADDQEPPTALRSAVAMFAAAVWPPGPLFQTPTLHDYDPMDIPCTGPNVIIKTGIKMTEVLANSLKMLGPFLPDGTVVTSGVRTSAQQANIIVRYANEVGVPVDPNSRESVEAARRKLVDKAGPYKMYISSVRYDPDAPSTQYRGHFGGTALDFSAGAGTPDILANIEAAVQTAQTELSTFNTTLILVEVPNRCVHVEFDSTNTYNPEDLTIGWSAQTGCIEDPNNFPIVAAARANFTMGPPSEDVDPHSPEGSVLENSDQRYENVPAGPEYFS